MKLPVTEKGIISLLIAIAENGNDYDLNSPKSTKEGHRAISHCIADIQNWCGENRDLLASYNLKYYSGLDRPSTLSQSK